MLKKNYQKNISKRFKKSTNKMYVDNRKRLKKVNSRKEKKR